MPCCSDRLSCSQHSQNERFVQPLRHNRCARLNRDGAVTYQRNPTYCRNSVTVGNSFDQVIEAVVGEPFILRTVNARTVLLQAGDPTAAFFIICQIVIVGGICPEYIVLVIVVIGVNRSIISSGSTGFTVHTRRRCRMHSRGDRRNNAGNGQNRRQHRRNNL